MFTSGSSFSGNLWAFTFWFKLPSYSKKQKITRTNSGVLDGSRAPFYKDFHSALPAAENRTTSWASSLGEVISVEV